MQQQVLIVDDSQPIHSLVKALLGDEPIDIHSAHDAGQGIVLAASLMPDLILLDVDMPGMNGFDACRQLKANPETSSIPIVFLTSVSTLDEKVCGLNLGAVDYITKPVKSAELLARVRACLRTSYVIRLLEQKAMLDFLTGLGNRAMFDKRLDAETSLRVRLDNPLTCITIDLDNFKSINDTFGYPTGDLVLKKVADAISTHCRSEDVACRIGGDEFAILAPNTTSEQAAILAGRIRASITGTNYSQAGNAFTVTVSVGIAQASDIYDRALAEHADEALYEAKKLGRDKVVVAIDSRYAKAA